MRVHCLSTGSVRPKRRPHGPRRYLPGGWHDGTLPVQAFLVEHPDGLCLFDAGQSAAAANGGYLPRWHPFLRLARFELTAADEAAAQVRRLGHDPGAVRWVVLSHLHTDHVGGLGPFAGAEVIVARQEWERAIGLAGRVRGYLPQHWPHGLEPRLIELDGAAVGPFAASLDLAADGRLLVVPLPGHTPGHVGLLALEDDGGFLLGGDHVHSGAELERSSPGLAYWCRAHGLVPLMAHDPGAAELTGALA